MLYARLLRERMLIIFSQEELLSIMNITLYFKRHLSLYLQSNEVLAYLLNNSTTGSNNS